MTTITSTTATQTATNPAMEYAMKKGIEAFGEGFKKVLFLAHPFSDIAGGLVRTGAGALAAAAFTAVAPWGGAAYGLTSSLTAYAVSWIDDKCNWPDNALTSVMKYALPKIAGIGAGLAAVALAGFALTPGTAIALVVGTVAFSAVGFAVLGSIQIGIGCMNGCREGYMAYNEAIATYSATTTTSI